MKRLPEGLRFALAWLAVVVGIMALVGLHDWLVAHGLHSGSFILGGITVGLVMAWSHRAEADRRARMEAERRRREAEPD